MTGKGSTEMPEIKTVRECVLTSEQIRQIRHKIYEVKRTLSESAIPMETAFNANMALENAIRNMVQAERFLDEEWYPDYD